MSSSTAWHGHAGQQHPAGGGAGGDDDHDLNRFLEMADAMHFDVHAFPHVDAPHSSFMDRHHQPDIVMSDSALGDGVLPHDNPVMAGSSIMATSAPDAAAANTDAQVHYLQHQKFHQPHRSAFFPQGHSVPPTPQSLEMHPAGSGLFSQSDHLSHGVYDGAFTPHMTERHDMAFTPLVSPAVTPLDPHFSIDHALAASASYLSPLTSPALRAQHDALSAYDQATRFSGSPVDMDLEPPAMSGLAINQDLVKKVTRNYNASAAAKARGKASIKSSPIAKPQRRRTGPSPAIMSQLMSEVEGRNPWSGDQALLPMPATSADGLEENSSVSPENLTDMPPPPIPNRRFTSDSPYTQNQNGASKQPSPFLSQKEEEEGGSSQQQQRQQQLQSLQPHPATPASLMKLPVSKSKRSPAASPEKSSTNLIESLELPEALADGILAPADGPRTSPALFVEPSFVEPSLAAKAPATQPLPSPSIQCLNGTAPGPSPQLQPGTAASSAKKTPKLAASNRKRSNGSMHASPALLPRISPNIKPLLPGTPGMSAAEDTASRLLTSKSNYQNILEGNTVPGVSYPSELSTNLTSKRTSHKIAEQGRRNRINTALQIMAGLLPDKHEAEAGDEADKRDGCRSSSTANSKASVVEHAITHMQKLQKENAGLKHQVEELRSQLAQVKKSMTDS